MRISVDLNSYHFVSDCSLGSCLLSLRSMGISEYMRILHQHNRTSSEIKSTSIHDGRNGLGLYAPLSFGSKPIGNITDKPRSKAGHIQERDNSLEV